MKALFSLSLLLCLIIAYPAVAQEASENTKAPTVEPEKVTTIVIQPEKETAATKQAKKNTESYDTMYASVFCSLGMTFPMGEIAGDGGQKGITGKGWSAGVLYGYRFFYMGSAYFKISYEEKEIITESNYMNKSMRAELRAAFVDFTIAYRGFFSIAYYDVGFYYGMPLGSWSRKVSLDGEVTETLLHGPYESRGKYDVGFLVGGGVSMPISDNCEIQLGVDFIIPVGSVYSDDLGNELNVFSLMFRTGMLYHW